MPDSWASDCFEAPLFFQTYENKRLDRNSLEFIEQDLMVGNLHRDIELPAILLRKASDAD
jgi:hypothetical protein